MVGQLRLWVERVEEVWRMPYPDPAPKKFFEAKNGLPRLQNYKTDPDEAFWSTFPENMQKEGTSLINAGKLQRLAERAGYTDMEKLRIVCSDIQNGADIGCKGVGRLPSESGNAPSAYEFPEQVTDAIASWVNKEFVYGPISEDDVPITAKINGIMCKQKPNGSVRIILNMSAPLGRSVNEGIDNAEFPAVMSSTGKWLAVLERAGRGCLMVKLDWSDAYKHIRVRKEDQDLQWFSWLGKYFLELCLIFGTTSSVGIYDRTAKVVLDLVLKLSNFPKENVCQHLDDVCAAGPAGTEEIFMFERTYREVAEEIGVRLAPTDDPDKAFKPCNSGTVLGVLYNTTDWTWSIPHEKEIRIVLQLREALELSHMRQADIWSLVGRILHYCPLIPAGRFNIDRLIKANNVSTDRRYPVELGPDIKRQMWFWLTMIRATSGHTRIPDVSEKFPAWTRECYTDAAGGSMTGIGRGAGAVSQEWWT